MEEEQDQDGGVDGEEVEAWVSDSGVLQGHGLISAEAEEDCPVAGIPIIRPICRGMQLTEHL